MESLDLILIVLLVILLVWAGYKLAMDSRSNLITGLYGALAGLLLAYMGLSYYICKEKKVEKLSETHPVREDKVHNQADVDAQTDLYTRTDLPKPLQDIYYYENTLSDQASRNYDNYPYQTPRTGPMLGPNWKFDNSDVVEHVLGHSRGLYGVDPTTYSGPIMQYTGANSEALDYDHLLAQRQRTVALTNKNALKGAVRTTRDIFNKYFATELDAESSKIWYGQEPDADTDYRPYN